MNRIKEITVMAIIAALLVLTACQPLATPTVLPTYTPFPTYTPLPTYTPFPTATVTPTPTFLPTATVVKKTDVPPTKTKSPYVPATSMPTSIATANSPSGGTTPVTWKNETSHLLRIVAVGPTTYSLTLKGGQEDEVDWLAGTYQVTYYLDGGSTPGGHDTFTVQAEVHNLLVVNFR